MDLSAYKLGDEITEAVCSQWMDLQRRDDETAYALALLALKQKVEQALLAFYGRIITVRALKGGLRILDDRESAEYNPKRFQDGLRIARRAHRRLMAVDVSKLTPREREEFGKTVTKQAAQLSMLRQRDPVKLVESRGPKLPSLFTQAKPQ